MTEKLVHFIGITKFDFVPEGKTESIRGASVHCAVPATNDNAKGMRYMKISGSYELFDLVKPEMVGKPITLIGEYYAKGEGEAFRATGIK